MYESTRSLKEIEREIVTVAARWDGIGQAVPREIHGLEVERAVTVREFAGCCGERYLDTEYCKYAHVTCPAIARGCRMASLPEIKAVLTEVEDFEPLS